MLITQTPRSFLSIGASMLLLQAVGMILAFVLSVTLARVLGPAEFGFYSYALSIATLLAVPVQLGLPTLVVRETARLKHADQTRQIYHLWSWATVTILLISVAISLPILVLAPLILGTSLSLPMLAMVLALVPLMSLAALRGAALRGLGHVIQGQLPEMLFRPVLVLALIWAAVLLSVSPGFPFQDIQAEDALALNLAATTLAFVAGVALLRRVAPTANTGTLAVSPHRYWIRTGIVLGLASSAAVVNRNLDMVMLGSMRPVAEVGVYKVSVTLAVLTATVLNVLNLAMQPRFVQMHAASDLAEMQRLVTLVSRLGFGAGCLTGLIFAALGEWLIGSAFGAQYTAAHGALLILLCGQLANTFFGPVIMVLNMSGHERLVLYGVLAAAAANIVLNTLLIPRFGSLGAATATAVTMFAWNLLLQIACWRRLGIDCSALGFHRKGTF